MKKILKAFGIDVSKGKARKPETGAVRRLGPAPEILDYLMTVMRNDRGVHAETILSTSGALCGYAAQRAIWQHAIEDQGMPVTDVFAFVGTKDGGTFLFSETVNQLLASEDDEVASLWRMVRQAAAESGAASLPDPGPIFARNAAALGSKPYPDFSTPANHRPGIEPAEALRHLWPKISVALEQGCSGALQWPITLGAVSAKLIGMTKDNLDPVISATLVMESAVAMSKLGDLEAA